MKILVDMNLSPQLCGVLAQNGFPSVHWSDVGDPTASDHTIMEWAAQNDCVVLTHDLDFGALLAASQASGPSVVQLRTEDVMPRALALLLVKTLTAFETEIESGALIVVNEARARVRILPLSR